MSEIHLARGKSVESKIRRVTKISISEEIAQQIMDLIANGDLKPGQRLPSERDLCKNFGVGRSSLREALRCLSIVGVLNARVGEGTAVAADGGKFLGKIIEWRLITEKHDIENLLDVRVGLEGVAAADAAAQASAAEIEKLQDLIGKMKSAVKSEKQFAVLDLEFHVTLAKCSGNALLFDLVSMIRGQLARALTKVLLLPNAIPLSLKEHTAVLEAIKRRDSEAARQAMHAHLSAARDRYNQTSGERMRQPLKSPKSSKSRPPA
jgi:GntR family transcriptional repressor for pyruvate dehydrogenase complex